MKVLKTCIRCHLTKPLQEYYKHPRMTDGHLNKCKNCQRAASADRYARVKDTEEEKSKRAKRNRALSLARLGITELEYRSMLAQQQNRCSICGTTDPGRGSENFPVDHDHATGAVRGILCHSCNIGLSNFNDDPDRMMAAAAYLLSTTDILGKVL